VVNWGASVPLVYWLGFNGAMVCSVIVLYVSLPLTWFAIRQIVKVEVIRYTWPAFLASVLAGLTAFKLNFLAGNLFGLFLVGFVGGLVYLVGLVIFDRKQLLLDARWFWQKIR
jgi:O-antigen/teichoic acid export membrane protein